MFWVDLANLDFLLVKLLISIAVVMIFISSIDDFFADIIYWSTRLANRYRKRGGVLLFTHEQLNAYPQKLVAIVVPAWQEAEVIARMAGRAASTLDYDNYHFFVGTYPNDPETQSEVDKISRKFDFVHKVVTRDPGPTSKADCLNNIIAAIQSFENEQKIEFAFVVMHDAEDVIHDQELKCFNYLMRYYDMVQIPVLPLRRTWSQFTSGHYLDEFTELHFKVMPTRSQLSGFVPSAGVGTALSRRAFALLMRIHDGVAFNTESLTEDYDIGHRVQKYKLQAIFATSRFNDSKKNPFDVERHSSSRDLRYNFIAVREYFPARFWQAVRQKTRWILGIVFQGYRSIGWPGGITLRYVLMRDRKAVFSMLSLSIAYFVVLNILLLEIAFRFTSDQWQFPKVISQGSWIWYMLICNGFFLLNRLLHRMGFVWYAYGIKEGLLSAPRMVWGNVINIFAMYRAVYQVLRSRKNQKKLAWDKTDHEFPDDH